MVRIFLTALGAAVMASCSMVDAVPDEPKPVKSVSEFYYRLGDVGAQYVYELHNTRSRDTIKMTMRGSEAGMIMLDKSRCYSAGIDFGANFSDKYYYAMNDSIAYNLERSACGLPGKLWVDLKAPLMVGQTWEFSPSDFYQPMKYKALVTRRGAQMKMPDGKIYTDVAEILYASSNQDTIVKYFARGVGLVYSTSNSKLSSAPKAVGLISTK